MELEKELKKEIYFVIFLWLSNIFIAQDETDLFPRDFIINLPAPDNYIGPNKVFGTSSETSEEEDDVLPIVIPIDDYKAFIPDGHKKDDLNSAAF